MRQPQIVRRLLVAALLTSFVALPASAQQVRLRVDFVDAGNWVEKSWIRFYVDLLDAEFRVVSGLSGQDVEVFTAGEKDPIPGTAEVTEFRETREGVAVAILMAGHNAYAPFEDEGEADDSGTPQVFALQKLGVQNFIRKLEGNDKVAIFMYDERSLRTIDTFSSMFPEAVQAVESNARLSREAGSAKAVQNLAPRLFNHIMEVIESRFGEQEELPRRKILIVMSDGLDVNSGNPERIEQRIKDIVQVARDYDIKIYTIGFSLGSRDNLRYLRELSAKTEGVYREIDFDKASTIPDVFAGLADEIKRQYVITFTSEDLEGGRAHRFRVQLKTGGRTLDAEYERDVKVDKKPLNIMRIVYIVGGVLGGVLFIFLIIKLVKMIAAARAARADDDDGNQIPAGDIKGRLVITAGPYAGQTFYLTKDTVTIGTLASNDLCLSMDDLVSKRHAGIKIDDMRYELADFGSTNKTFVNGHEVNKQFLRDQDRVRIGSTEMQFLLK